MITAKNLLYALTCLSFTIIFGAAVYEHLAVWPRAYEAPPQSLAMFQGDYGLNSIAFWSKIHLFTTLFMLISLIVFWKSKRRKNLGIAFLGYGLIMAVTATYFVPELIAINSTTFSQTVDPDLVARGDQWESLSLVRLAFGLILAFILYLGLTKPLHDPISE